MNEQDQARMDRLEQENRVMKHYAYMTAGSSTMNTYECGWCGPICHYPKMPKRGKQAGKINHGDGKGWVFVHVPKFPEDFQ